MYPSFFRKSLIIAGIQRSLGFIYVVRFEINTREIIYCLYNLLQLREYVNAIINSSFDLLALISPFCGISTSHKEVSCTKPFCYHSSKDSAKKRNVLRISGNAITKKFT